MKTLSRKMLGYALGRTVMRPIGRWSTTWRAAGGDASFSDLAVKIVTSRQFRNRRRPTPVADAASRRRSRRGEATHRSREQVSMSTRQPRHPSRRHFLRGVGVALALPWMESLPVFGQAAGAR